MEEYSANLVLDDTSSLGVGVFSLVREFLEEKYSFLFMKILFAVTFSKNRGWNIRIVNFTFI